MKRIINITLVGAMIIGSYFLGTTQSETEVIPYIPDGYIDARSNEFKENYVDLRQVTYFEVEEGLQLYTIDGSVYYW